MFGSTNPFEQSSTSPFGQTNSVFGQNNSSNNPFTPKPFGSTTPFGSQTGSSTGVFGAAQTPSPFGSSMPAFGSSSTPAFGSSSTSFGGLLTPTSAFVDTGFGQSGLFGGQRGGITVVSYPAITEEDGGTSGQTAKLESISAMPAYKDKRLESCVAIAGADYCVIAADYTGDLTKISQLTEKSVMASSGFQADVKALQKVLSASHLIYQLQHDKPMSCPAMASVLSHTLFYNRFFPYSAFNVLGRLDSEGKGCVFTYSGDAVACEKVGNSSQGSGSTLKSRSPLLLPAKDAVTPLFETEAVDLAKTVFASAADRDIYTGDKVEIVVLNASGLRREYMDLRKD